MNKELEQFWEAILTEQPEIRDSVTLQLEEEFGGYYFLSITSKNRECVIRFVNQSPILHCQFLWDDCLLFNATGKDSKTTAALVKRWLCDFATPSELKHEFNWLTTGRLAKFYEEGRGLEGEFLLSWDYIEEFYNRLESFQYKTDALDFIAQMRSKGFDRTLRAGQSMYTFIVSRARHHHWVKSYISFDFHENRLEIEADIHGKKRLSLPVIELSNSALELLHELEAIPIEDLRKEIEQKTGKLFR